MICISEVMEGRRSLRPVSPDFTKEYDVVVCGLGTAGSLAALFSAENGLSVLGIEAFTCVGGTHTAGGMTGNYFGCPGGRYEELDEQVKAFTRRYTCTPAESRLYLTEQALCQQGVALLYGSVVCGVYLEENTVIGLRVLTGGSLVDIRAKLVMDCTAEAFVASMAGCETRLGRETDGQTQPYSLVCMLLEGDSCRYTNIDFGRVDQFDPISLSDAILYARAHADTGIQMPLLGIREGRRIVAEETVTLKDLFAGKQTKKPMFYSYSDLDKHGWDIAFDGEVLGDWAIGANLGAYNVTVAVPYKAILPKDYEGILVPCRALGVDRDISSCVRMNRDMKKVAEVAAQWATLAIGQRKPLREVSYAQLRERLTCISEDDDRGCRVDGKRNWDGTPVDRRAVQWINDPARLEAVLQTETPGEAIWSARRMGTKALPALQGLLCSVNENTRKHAAFALAALGSTAGVEVLRQMAAGRDGLMLKDCRKHNNLRGCMAIYWLGRLGDAEAVPILTELICNEREPDRAVYHQKTLTTRYPIAEFNNIYFQFVSQAVMALIRIGNARERLRPQIGSAFRTAFSTDDYYPRITSRPPQSSEGNIACTVKRIALAALQIWKT